MKITTVCGDIAPENLGYTTMHEHTLLTMDPLFGAFLDKSLPTPPFTLESSMPLKTTGGWMATKEELMYNDMDAEVKELEAFAQVGGKSLLDCSYNGCRLDIRDTKTLSERSGINIVACAGFFSELTYPGGFDPMNKDKIRQRELREIREGIDGTDIKAGCLKVGFGAMDAMTGSMSENELAVFRATCSVAAETGYPVAIHGSFIRENLLKLLDIAVDECGVQPEKIDVCHLDSYITGKAEHPDYRTYVKDPNNVIDSFADFAFRVLDKGVYVNFDGWGAFHTSIGFDGGLSWGMDDNRRLSALLPLLEKGYGKQILFGHDKAGGCFNYYAGAYGYTRFPTFTIPAIKAMGFEREAEWITVENPARFLAHE